MNGCLFTITQLTFASNLLANGADNYYVSKMLGHANIHMTLVPYSRNTATQFSTPLRGIKNKKLRNVF